MKISDFYSTGNIPNEHIHQKKVPYGSVGDWSNGMILASGARGREFDSRITPSFFVVGGVAQMVERMLSICLLYTSPSPRDRTRSRMPSSA